MNEIAAIGLHSSLARAADAPKQLAREFDAMVFRMLWRSAAVPGARGAKSATPALGAALADFFAPQMAAQHSAGFGALMLAALDSDQNVQPRRR
jgi:hypothetical protein